MYKLIVVVSLAVLLAGCKDTKDTNITVEDNSPGVYEREDAMQRCTGVLYKSQIVEAPTEIRIACTQAIYGGK